MKEFFRNFRFGYLHRPHVFLGWEFTIDSYQATFYLTIWYKEVYCSYIHHNDNFSKNSWSWELY